ncbi:MAG: hypothetical protein ACRDIL_01415 [Candidatus Limnocylindrales bacterium]
MTLREVLEAAAAAAPDVIATAAADGATVWAVRGVEFATLSSDGTQAAFLLDPIVAGAATRTPDVARSQRGPGWVEMRPAVFDGHAADRANAWFLSGHRRLTGPGA